MSDLDPSSVVNEALDAIAWPEVLGDIEDGSHQAQVALRKYQNCLKEILRCATWDFARKEAPLLLLADATNNTENVGTSVPRGWIYEYAYPNDCIRMRFIPADYQNPATQVPADNVSIAQTPLVSGGNTLIPVRQVIPTRFLIATDPNNLPSMNPIPWDQPGISPAGRTVILSNVKNAVGVYTSLMLYPSLWDPLFRAAVVAYLASEIAMPLWSKTDRKFGMICRNQQLDIVRAKVTQARLIDGNEVGLETTDIRVDWMDRRRSGGPGFMGQWGMNGWGDGSGILAEGFGSIPVANAVF